MTDTAMVHTVMMNAEALRLPRPCRRGSANRALNMSTESTESRYGM
jgi:hypothetical protein